MVRIHSPTNLSSAICEIGIVIFLLRDIGKGKADDSKEFRSEPDS